MWSLSYFENVYKFTCAKLNNDLGDASTKSGENSQIIRALFRPSFSSFCCFLFGRFANNHYLCRIIRIDRNQIHETNWLSSNYEHTRVSRG